MVSAAVLPFPSRSLQDTRDLKSKVMDAATTALQLTVDAIVKDLKGKDLQALSETLLEKGQSVTGTILSTLLNGLAADDKSSAACPKCNKQCAVHSSASRDHDAAW